MIMKIHSELKWIPCLFAYVGDENEDSVEHYALCPKLNEWVRRLIPNLAALLGMHELFILYLFLKEIEVIGIRHCKAPAIISIVPKRRIWNER